MEFLNHNWVPKTKLCYIKMPKFYKYLRSSYPKYKNYHTKILSMFGHEQLFFIMKPKKKKKKSYCSQLKDSRLNSIQHIKTWNARPYIDMLGQKESVTFLHLKQRSNELWKKKLIIKYFYFFQMLCFFISNLIYNLWYHTYMFVLCYVFMLWSSKNERKFDYISGSWFFLHPIHFTHFCCISGFCRNLNLQSLVYTIFFSPTFSPLSKWACIKK